MEKHGDAPAGVHATIAPTAIGQGTPVTLRSNVPYERWAEGNVIRGAAKGTVSAIAYARLGDITADQFRALASIQRELGATVRLTNRQNLAFRDLTEEQLPKLFERLDAIGMAQPGAELSRDVVACPGADTCNLAVTQSRGLADAIGARLEEEGLGEVGGVRFNISGCTNSCGQHHIADIGFSGAERRAHGTSAPGYTMLLGGYVGQTEVHFGERALRLPAKAAPEAAVRVVRRFAGEREAGETFRGWIDRVGGVKAVAGDLKELDAFPSPEDGPDYYVDYGETGPYVAEVGDSSAPRDHRRDAGRHRRPGRPRPHRPGARRDQRRVRAPAGLQDHPVGRGSLRAPPGHDRIDDRRGAHRPRPPGRPGDRGGLHRHRLPLPRDASATVEEVRRHYGLNLRMMTVARQDEALWAADPENCCSAVKVGQLDRALARKAAWMSGLRRGEAGTRAGAPIVSRDLRGLVKVNPIATWTDDDVADYIAEHDVIVNPLTKRGYPSIGCMPCTTPVANGEDPRAGRWRGKAKTECGLHLA
ncbi:MAG: phosphoadenylyl-sulfate reductase [Acidimicrobiales bacterium]